MRFMIHACPARLWFVEGWLAPELRRQGAEDVTVWCDEQKIGNLQACRASFAACGGDGDTWHLQDDVLPASDFVRRAKALEDRRGVICGFVNENGGPNANLTGEQRGRDVWYSFPCVRIPNGRARALAAWIRDGGDGGTTARSFINRGIGDDWFFRRYMEMYYPDEPVLHCKPCLVEHIDFPLGGSQCTPWRGYWARAAYWDEPERVDEVTDWIKTHRPARVGS